MLTAIAVLHLLVSVALIFVVLLQTGRGSEIGAAFGSGASQTLFGSSGTTGFMTKLTTGAVVIFMLTSLLLAYFYSHREYVIKAPTGQTEQTLPAQPEGKLPVPEPVKPAEPGK
jgi:preprotein translocase subunit SecG